MSRIAVAVRDAYGYGEYLEWLAAEFGLAAATGDRLLRVHKNLISTFNLKVEDMERIAPSALYLLASDETPQDVRTESVAKAESGKRVTHAEVKQAVVKAKAKAETQKVAVTERPKPPPVDFLDGDEAKDKSKAPEKPAPATLDAVGNKLMRAEHVELFGRRGELNKLLTTISEIKATVMGAIAEKDELFRYVNGAKFKADIENAYRDLKFGIPYALCPYHADDDLSRKGCKCCKGFGIVPKDVYEQAPASLRKGAK